MPHVQLGNQPVELSTCHSPSSLFLFNTDKSNSSQSDISLLEGWGEQLGEALSLTSWHFCLSRLIPFGMAVSLFSFYFLCSRSFSVALFLFWEWCKIGLILYTLNIWIKLYVVTWMVTSVSRYDRQINWVISDGRLLMSSQFYFCSKCFNGHLDRKQYYRQDHDSK
jgi:hypothetical protein